MIYLIVEACGNFYTRDSEDEYDVSDCPNGVEDLDNYKAGLDKNWDHPSDAPHRVIAIDLSTVPPTITEAK